MITAQVAKHSEKPKSKSQANVPDGDPLCVWYTHKIHRASQCGNSLSCPPLVGGSDLICMVENLNACANVSALHAGNCKQQGKASSACVH